MEYIYETLQVHAWHWDDVSWTRKTTLACLVFELSALDLIPYRKPCPCHNSLTLRRCVLKKEDNFCWRALSITLVHPVRTSVLPNSCRAITPKLYGIYLWNFTGASWHSDDVSWTRKTTLVCLVFELHVSALDLVPYSKPCPVHNSLTVWNIFIKLYRCLHDIETMCHEQDNSCLFGFWIICPWLSSI